MKPWIKKTLIGFAGATLLVGGLTACGSRGHHDHAGMSPERVMEMRGKVIERVSDKLDLNEAQKLKLGVLADEMIAQRQAMRGDSDDPRTELKALIAGDKFDRSRAQTLLTQKTEVVQAGVDHETDAFLLPRRVRDKFPEMLVLLRRDDPGNPTTRPRLDGEHAHEQPSEQLIVWPLRVIKHDCPRGGPRIII